MTDSLDQWLARIEAIHPAEIELGLSRVQQVYQRLPQLPSTTSVITVAGTNGKGSTVQALAALGIAAGKRVATYTSPHLLRYNERVQIQQAPVSDARLVAAFEQVDKARQGIELTYFEFGTLAALVIFAEQPLDWVVLEVGLGGRLDAVNIVDPSIAIITSVAMDHEAWLGNSREAIGREKAGIIRPGGTFICGELNPPDAVKQAAQAAKNVYWQGRSFGYDSKGRRFWLAAGTEQYIPCQEDLPILAQNLAVGLQACQLLGVDVAEPLLHAALPHLGVPGRQQLLQVEPYIMLDVGHNPQAAQALALRLAALKKQYNIQQCHCLLGMLADKNHADTIAELLPQIDYWWTTDLQAGQRSSRAEDLGELLLHAGAIVKASFKSPRAGYRYLKPLLSNKDLLLVFGSFYTVADILENT